MRRGRIGWVWAALAAVGLALGGCGQNIFEGSSSDSGDEAAVEKGVEALNSEDWGKAIAIFEPLFQADPNPQNAKYLASAYVGAAGFDTLALVDEITQAQDQGTDESVIYDSVTAIFDADGDGVIEQSELEGKGDLFVQALQVLVPEYSVAPGRVPAAAVARLPTDQETFQAGLYAAVHAILSVVAQLEDPSREGYLLLTLDELRAHPEVIADVEAPETLNRDLRLVAAARDVLIAGLAGEADKNDIAAEFDKFLIDVGFGDENVTNEELQNYLQNLLALI